MLCKNGSTNNNSNARHVTWPHIMNIVQMENDNYVPSHQSPANHHQNPYPNESIMDWYCGGNRPSNDDYNSISYIVRQLPFAICRL